MKEEKETITDFATKYPPKRFEYRFTPYMIILMSGLGVWILLGILANSFETFAGLSVWMTFERLVWWFALIVVMFYMDRRNSRMALDHNLQNLSTMVREREMLEAVIHYKKLAEKPCGGKCKCQKTPKKKLAKKNQK